MPDIVTFIGFSALILFTSMLASILGFGGLLVLIACLSLFVDIKYSIALGTMYSLVASLSRTVIFRKYIEKKLVGYLAIGIIPGSILGLYLFSIAKSEVLSVFFGAFIIAYVVNKLINLKFHFTPSRWVISIVSFIFASTSSIIGATGPIMVILMQQLKNTENEFIAMMAVIFLINGLLKFIGYLYLGIINLDNIAIVISIVVFAIVGSIAGKKLVHKIPQKVLGYCVLAFLLVYGVRAIWSALV
jgi:uncharacterized membrane protein YfcA